MDSRMNIKPNSTLFITLANGSCYFVPASSDANPALLDVSFNGKSRFSVYLFDTVGIGTSLAYARAVRTVYDGPVVTETWDCRHCEWIPS